MLATVSPGLQDANSDHEKLNLPEKILTSMHFIRNIYHFLFAHFIPDAHSADGTKKEYLDFCYMASIIKSFRT